MCSAFMWNTVDTYIENLWELGSLSVVERTLRGGL